MDRSERKLREKLTQGGYPDCCVDAAIDYVKSFHYLDDYRFCFHICQVSSGQLKPQAAGAEAYDKGHRQR